MARWNDWWQARAERERWILRIGALLALLILGYGLLWLPLSRARDGLRQQVQQGERDLNWMRQVPASALTAPSATFVAPSGESLLSRLDRGARAAGLGNALLAVEPVTDGEVRMRFQQVDFDAAMRWLETQSAAGIRVRELSVQRAESEGRSDLRVALGEGASN
ncbi:MAG: type II secretion system protein M [Rhodanobacteraceae bacterium]|nr:type II secretion system protein M [Rhodanobacteraceae bacterium]HPF72667.1 type II secretion system protein GspM [Xanthomonadaceae bacterium]HRY00093.1 type II secretion system protein GspM [Xanthomonadaceae bacterium]